MASAVCKPGGLSPGSFLRQQFARSSRSASSRALAIPSGVIALIGVKVQVGGGSGFFLRSRKSMQMSKRTRGAWTLAKLPSSSWQTTKAFPAIPGISWSLNPTVCFLSRPSSSTMRRCFSPRLMISITSQPIVS